MKSTALRVAGRSDTSASETLVTLPVEPLLLDAPDAARLLGISTRTLATHVKSGRVPVVRFGRRTKFSRTALESWIAREVGAQLGNAG